MEHPFFFMATVLLLIVALASIALGALIYLGSETQNNTTGMTIGLGLVATGLFVYARVLQVVGAGGLG